MNFKNCIVITGSIGCGKSSVCKLLKAAGYAVIDADVISKEVASQNIKSIIDVFGDDYLKDGALDTKKLGNLVFSDSEAKAKLEAIMHPLIKKKIFEEAQKLEKNNKIYFIDIPLFFEGKNYSEFSPVVVVYAPREAQIKRVLLRNNLSEQDVLARIQAQMDIEEKVKKADFVIDNSGNKEELNKKVDNFLKEVENWFCKNTAQAEMTF